MHKITIALALLLACTTCSQAESFAAVKHLSGGRWAVTMDDGSTLTVPDTPGNRHRDMVRQWIADGKPVDPADEEPPAVKRRNVLERILQLHTRRAALTVERDYWVTQGATARVTALNTLLQEAQAQIDALRPQS